VRARLARVSNDVFDYRTSSKRTIGSGRTPA
jgi:hypothetical protein